MKEELDMAKIAEALGAERYGKVLAKGGRALALLADVQARFRVSERGRRQDGETVHR